MDQWEDMKNLKKQEKQSKTLTAKSTLPMSGYGMFLTDCGGMTSKKQVNIFKLLFKTVPMLTALLILNCFSLNSLHAETVTGTASFYGLNAQKEHLNKNTASGEVFYPSALTAASYQYYKKYVLLKSVRTGKELWVYCNDKGPNKRLGRMIDLTPAAFLLLENDYRQGLTTVEILEVRP